MSTYKKADFYELCRLCMCVGGTKYHIFKSRESCDRKLQSKLKKCIPLQIKENDTLPKGVCGNCVSKVEEFYEFIDQCVNTESMLKTYCMTLSVSDQLKCQGKVYVRQSIENSCDDNSVSPKKNDSSDHSTILTMQSLSNLVQSGSIQIVNGMNGRYQDFSKYDIQSVTSTTNGVESNKHNNYTVANNSNQLTQTDESNDENDASENVQTIYSVPDIPSPDKEDTEMNINSLSYVTPLTVEPEMLHFQFNKSESNDQDSDLDNKTEVSDDVKSYMNSFLPSDGAFASCTACGKVLESEEEIVMHSQMCNAINDKSVRNLPTRSARDMMPPRFPCDVCEKKFKRKEHLIQHRKLHTGERPYSCETCSKSFSRKEHLMRHMLSHTGQRLYGCDLCHKHFSRKDNLHKHRTTHGVTGPLVCQTCGKSFIVKHYYDMHMATHNEVVDESQLPYVCDICKKRFATSQFLVTHRFRHRVKAANDIKIESESVIEESRNNVNNQQGNQNQLSNVPNINTYQVSYEDNNS